MAKNNQKQTQTNEAYDLTKNLNKINNKSRIQQTETSVKEGIRQSAIINSSTFKQSNTENTNSSTNYNNNDFQQYKDLRDNIDNLKKENKTDIESLRSELNLNIDKKLLLIEKCNDRIDKFMDSHVSWKLFAGSILALMIIGGIIGTFSYWPMWTKTNSNKDSIDVMRQDINRFLNVEVDKNKNKK